MNLTRPNTNVMLRTCFLLLFLFPFLCGYSQDKIILHLDNNFEVTDDPVPAIVRTVVIKDKHYFLTDQYFDGKMINYGEYNSVNPFIEDGLSKHYDENGNLYSVGNYKNGKLTGEWIYYLTNSSDTVDYQTAEDYYPILNDNCSFDASVYSENELLIAKIEKEILKFTYSGLKLPARSRDIFSNYKVKVEFVLDTDSLIKCPKIENENIDLVFEILRVLFLYKGNLVSEKPIKLKIPILFNYSAENKADQISLMDSKDSENGDEGVWFADENATFSGGDLRAFQSWMEENCRYPADAALAGVMGKVIAQFAVDTEGNVCDIKIIQKVHPSLDKELIRILKCSPKWTPGVLNGKKVKQLFVVPLSFLLR